MSKTVAPLAALAGVLLLAAAPASAQSSLPDLAGVWASGDSITTKGYGEEGEPWASTTLYQVAEFADSLSAWTVVVYDQEALSVYRDTVGYRVEGDRVVFDDGAEAVVRRGGDRLTFAYSSQEEGSAETVMGRVASMAGPPGLTGSWVGEQVEAQTGVVYEVGFRFADDGTVAALPDADVSQPFMVAGPFLIVDGYSLTNLVTDPFFDGQISPTAVYRMSLSGDRLALEGRDLSVVMHRLWE